MSTLRLRALVRELDKSVDARRCSPPIATALIELLWGSGRIPAPRTHRYASTMPTVIPDPPPAEIEVVLERRRRLGLDRRDEVWEGVLHVAPSPLRRHAVLQAQLLELLGPLGRAVGLVTAGEFNLGEEDDYRIPDAALLAPGPDQLYVPTASLAIETLSPGDETQEKLPFYAEHGVGEVLIVDPEQRRVQWLRLAEGEYRPIERSALIDLSARELQERLDWPEGQ